MPTKQENEIAALIASKERFARASASAKKESPIWQKKALDDATDARIQAHSDFLARAYAKINASSHWQNLPALQKRFLSEQLIEFDPNELARFSELTSLDGHVISNVSAKASWLDQFVAASKPNRPAAFNAIVEDAAEQARHNRVDLGIASAVLAIGGAAGYTAAAAGAGFELGFLGIAAIAKAATTKAMVRFATPKLIDKIAEGAFERWDEKIDQHFMSDAGRLATRIVLWSAKALTLQASEAGADMLFHIAGFEKKSAAAETIVKALDAWGLPNTSENVKTVADAVSELGKSTLEKIAQKVPLSETELDFAKGVGENLVIDSPEIVGALWKAGRRKAQGTREATLMLHAMFPQMPALAEGALSVYGECGFGAGDKKRCEEKKERLLQRPKDLLAEGLPRGELYLTLGLPEAAFEKYLKSGWEGRASLLKQYPPDAGEVKAAAMTPWQNMNVKSGIFAAKIATIVNGVRLAAAGAQGALWVENVSKEQAKKILDWTSHIVHKKVMQTPQSAAPPINITHIAPPSPLENQNFNGKSALLSRLNIRRANMPPTQPSSSPQPMKKNAPPTP